MEKTTGVVQVKTWFAIIISIIAIISATIGLGQYLTFGTITKRQEMQETRIRVLELQYASSIAEIKANQRSILAQLKELKGRK